MMKLLPIFALLFFLGDGDGKKEGRTGNAHYEAERYDQAEASFRTGIDAVQDQGVNLVHAGLLNNLGAALYRQGKFEEAAAAFSGSARMAPSSPELVRGHYNAGNASFKQEQLQAAVDHYRNALLNDPGNQDAKFNYEFARRMLDEQNEQNQDQQQSDENNSENQDQQEQEQQQDQNENQEQQQDQEQQQQDSGDQQQNQQQENGDQQEPEQQQQQESDPRQLSQEEAQRILQALQNEEQQLLRQVQKMDARPRRVEKDW